MSLELSIASIRTRATNAVTKLFGPEQVQSVKPVCQLCARFLQMKVGRLPRRQG